MPKSSPYKIGLGSKILFRGKVIFGSLVGFVLVTVILGLQVGIVSGDFEKTFTQPWNQFKTNFVKTMLESEESSLTPTPLSLPTLIPTEPPSPIPTQKPPTVVRQVQPQAPACTRLNIREGEFAGNKCYSSQDYEDLNYYLTRYSNAQFNLGAAEGTIRITCNCRVQQECDFFKDSCEEARQKKSQTEADISKYKGIIQGIIAKGS